jgi:hypothetical protein
VFVSAFSEQFASWQRLQERALRGDRGQFLAILDNIPDVEPEAYDQM